MYLMYYIILAVVESKFDFNDLILRYQVFSRQILCVNKCHMNVARKLK